LEKKQANPEDERSCIYVSSRGILKSCDIHNAEPKSSSKYLDPTVYTNIPANSTVYVCTEAIPNFIENFLPSAQGPIVVVSGDSDLSFPTDHLFLESPTIRHWFAQNCTSKHPKLSPIPIGLDYHTAATQENRLSPMMTPREQEEQIHAYAAIQPRLWRRDPRAYGNYLLNMSRGNRREALAGVPKELMIYERRFIPREMTWWKQASCAFTISPHGNGLDCHRTWETLILGGIPIVESSCLDLLYEDLPVLSVKSWSDVTRDLMDTTIQTFQERSFDKERLTLQYWLTKIKEKTK
jgi:hypothetical protein